MRITSFWSQYHWICQEYCSPAIDGEVVVADEIIRTAIGSSKLLSSIVIFDLVSILVDTSYPYYFKGTRRWDHRFWCMIA